MTQPLLFVIGIKKEILQKIALRYSAISIEEEDTMAEKKNNRANDISGRYAKETSENAIPGINTPGVALPAFNPPVPNRAWTAMRMGKDIDELTEEEKRDLYLGRDGDI